jgi:hypothetical protein
MPNYKPFFKTTCLGENVINLWPILGYFFNEPTKSSLIGEKSAQSGHTVHRQVFMKTL